MNSGSEDVVFPFYSFYSFLFSVTGLGSSRISETKVGLGARVPCSGPAEPEVLGARRSILLLHLPPFSPPRSLPSSPLGRCRRDGGCALGQLVVLRGTVNIVPVVLFVRSARGASDAQVERRAAKDG